MSLALGTGESLEFTKYSFWFPKFVYIGCLNWINPNSTLMAPNTGSRASSRLVLDALPPLAIVLPALWSRAGFAGDRAVD